MKNTAGKSARDALSIVLSFKTPIFFTQLPLHNILLVTGLLSIANLCDIPKQILLG